VEEYPKLRDKHHIGTYYTSNANWWQSEDLAQLGALLGGDFAAVYYSKSAKPTSASVYLEDQQQWDFLRELQSTEISQPPKNPGHGVNVFSKFRGKLPQQASAGNVTHPLITYVDLLSTGNSSNRLESSA